MSDSLVDLSWPAARLGEALDALARRSHLPLTASNYPRPPGQVFQSPESLDRWIAQAAHWLGCEAEAVDCPYPDVRGLVERAGPAIARLGGATGPRFLAILDGRTKSLRILTPDHAVVRVAIADVRSVLCLGVEESVAKEVDRVLAETGVPRRRRARVRSALLDQFLVEARVGNVWLLRPPAGSHVLAQARESELPRLLMNLVAAQALGSAFWIGSWWLLGGMTTTGRIDAGWLAAWVFLIVSTALCRLMVSATAGGFAVRVGSLLKRRLLAGVLALGQDEVRRAGIGQFYGQVLESEAIELMGLSGGYLGLAAALELALAVPVLAFGAGGWPHVGLLAATVAATFALGVRYFRARADWTEQRIAMTNDLVERMVGHRTRLAQEPHDARHDDEECALERYLHPSRTLDILGAGLHVLSPRGWLLVGLFGLVPGFVRGDASAEGLAVGLGGVLLAYRALRALAESLEKTAAAVIAWRRVRTLWTAAQRTEPSGSPDFASMPPFENTHAVDRPRLDARTLVYRHGDDHAPVLDRASLGVNDGERILLQGRSGGGKSTLAAVLAGLRVPESGLLLWDGLDRRTLGSATWRRRVALAPQFHENHILMGPLAFNLLMGRAWPPSLADIEEAERVCRNLSLGPLLDRMPAGLMQVVGETGWQLSHGERSRVFLARALLQEADLVILDESFAALDPQTLSDALAYVLERASTLIVVAHP